MSRFGLIGKNIDYSFSKSFFTEKFEIEGLSHYSNYTLLDLLRDFIQAYSWKIDRGHTMSLSDFIRLLQAENYAHAVVYGNDMMRIIEEA